MNVLGLSYDFHDASAALVNDERLVATCAEERFSLIKHDGTFPRYAIRACLDEARLEPQDLDRVIFYEQPSVKFTRVLSTPFVTYPRGMGQFVNSMRTWLGSKLWVRNAISSELGIHLRIVEFSPHHESHIAQAFCASGFSSAAVLIIDGVGEWACTTLARAWIEDGQLAYKIIEQYDYPNSIGIVYAAFTAFLGFKPNSGESSTMALAAFGATSRVEDIRKILRLDANGSYEVDASFFNFEASGEGLFKQPFIDLFGSPKDFRQPYPFDALNNDPSLASEQDRRFADIAASLQFVLSDIICSLARRLAQATGEARLCFAGGVALNCVSNSRLMSSGLFEDVFIPPDPGDGGAAFGAAYLGRVNMGADARLPMSAYLGASYASDSLQTLLSSGVVSECLGEPSGLRANTTDFRWDRESREDILLDRVVELLMDGKIVAWFQGRFEVGPRALGNRSLLVHPGRIDAIRRMSRTIKSHTPFRPYALSMTAEAAPQVLATNHLGCSPLKWMQTVWPLVDQAQPLLRGGIHVDGTTRPQICTQSDNPLFWKLLNRFADASGVPALLNTSLNERSTPIVATPEMALAMFIRTGIDALAIADLLLVKTDLH